MSKVKVKFEGIDYWNRPVFKAIDSKSRYGSVDILCNTEKEVLEIEATDLLYFGTSFDCEPMGSTPVNEIEIVVKGFQIVGWYDNIEADKRTASNISDGSIMPTKALADEYVKFYNMHVSSIKEHENCDLEGIKLHLETYNKAKGMRKEGK